jgi:DNA topoisomerase-1
MSEVMLLKVAARFLRAYTPAENIAINWLVADPDATMAELIHEVKSSDTEMWDSVTRQMVDPREVEKALHKLAPQPLSGSDLRVYHATDLSTAKMLVRRGFIPETKPHATTEEYEYAPGRGLDSGLYVGASPRDVDGYGRAILEIVVPKHFLSVPTEQVQLGETDPIRSLHGHDGAVINHRLPADAFRLMLDKTASTPQGWTEGRGQSGRQYWTSLDGKYEINDAGSGPQRFQIFYLKAGKRHEDIGWPSLKKAFQYIQGEIGLKQHPMAKLPKGVAPGDWLTERVAARYKQKKKVRSEDGGETTVYVYSEKQIAHRNREKAKRIEKLSKSIKGLRTKVKKDLRSSDPETMLTALAVSLMDHTFERVGNEGSAEEGHVGVTGWQKKHVSFGSKGCSIKYTGKSGVKHEKKVTDAGIRRALKDAYEAMDDDDSCLFHWDGGKVTADKVNSYLEPFDITAKDIRGYHANDQMRSALKSVRSGGKKLSEDKKAKEKQLKEEFKKALEETAESVGHEPSTLKSQYLVPGLEESYLKDGTILDKLGSLITESDARHGLSWDDKAMVWVDEVTGERKDPIEWSLPKNSHYQVLCKNCGSVLRQCRCYSPDRVTLYEDGPCPECPDDSLVYDDASDTYVDAETGEVGPNGPALI